MTPQPLPGANHWNEHEPLEVPWRAQADDLIGGWCVTFPAADPRTPADGAISVADFVRQEDAEHIAELHNIWLDRVTMPPDHRSWLTEITERKQ